jgi:1,4-alpha-glucan branching enzyme
VLAYMQERPEDRHHHYRRLTFGFHYAFDENFVLSLSHDEVVHLKRSLLEKMPGDEWQKFANLRLLYAFMYAHPGKKLLFMGGEFGQRQEWDYATSLNWQLLDLEPHRSLSRFVADLNVLYRSAPALHQADFWREGFEGIDLDSPEQNVIAFLRKSGDPRDALLFVANFSGRSYESYRIGVPFPTVYRELLNSDGEAYGGRGRQLPAEGVTAEEKAWHGYRFSLSLPLPPLTALVLQPVPAAIAEISI